MGKARRRRRVEPTDEWEQLALLCRWPEQLAYEEIRPLVLFGSPAAERAEQTGSSGRTLYRRAARFDEEGVESLFDVRSARRRRLPPALRRLIADLKAEYPPFSLGEVARICYVRTGRRPGKHTVERVLAEEPAPLRILRRFDPYHEIGEPKERRRAYSITVLENYSRAVLASAVSPTQDLSAFLSVLHRAVEKHGSPEALVTDSGSVFRANRAKAVYGALGIRKEGIERGRPWQNYLETAFNVQRRMADHHFARAGSWPELVSAHSRWVEDYNGQYHFAHEKRPDGKRTPAEVLGLLTEVRYRPRDLDRAFFSERFSRALDPSGYATWRRWRVYGEEGLAGREAALWLREKTLTVEHQGEPLSRYEVDFSPGTEKPRALVRPVLFETTIALPQPKLFRLDSLGESGWLKALRLEDYAPRRRRRRSRPGSLQQALFARHEAWG